MTTIERLKKEIERINNLKKGISKESWMTSQIRFNLIITQAKLSQHIETRREDVEEFKKKIDNMPCLDKRHISHPCQEHPKIINADELKSSLEKDEEKEIEGNSK